MRRDKDKAFKLRKNGKTYREIENLLGVSRSTLCNWFRNEKWSKHIKKSNTSKHIKISTERLLKMNEARRVMLEKKYKKVEEEAVCEFEIYKNDPLFMAGLMVYAGEGDKKSRNLIRVSNTEFYIHKVFISFAEKYLKILRSNIKIALISYEDIDNNAALKKWSQELKISHINFHKTQIIKGKEKQKRLLYGIGISIISSTELKKKILKWLELCKVYFN